MLDSGYLVYLKNDTQTKYEFNKTTGKGSSLSTNSLKQNTSRQLITTFGRTPYVYYGGNTCYKTIDLTTVFLAQYDDKGNKVLTARQYANQFIEMVNKRKPIIVENKEQGTTMICDVQITNDVSPTLYTKDDLEYVEITINCTEIE